MSGLNEREKLFVRDFLGIMNDEGVRALATTVTRRMVKAESRDACIDAIILHSTSLEEFLKRQKVTKENLFKYLNERKISVPNTDKGALESQIKLLVNGGSSQTSHSSVAQHVKQNAVPVSSQIWTAGESSCNPSHSAPLHSSPQFTNFQFPGAAQLYLAAASATKIMMHERVTTATYTNISGASLFMNPPKPTETAITNEFVKWFYSRVNQSGGVLPEDFWPDSNIIISLKRKNDVDQKTSQGGSNVARIFNETLKEHQLYLSPSPQGTWGKGNDEGLLLVLVCGTLHQRPSASEQCLGSFENLFLLAQDPFAEHNWKIRTLEVILRSNPHIHQFPTIQDSELAKNIKL